jgi:predicted unusual protein kinase regulating ubiquinone biosynthesis (AarF/ABC1/UbiB family)
MTSSEPVGGGGAGQAPTEVDSWTLPGTWLSRRAQIYATATRVAARYAPLAPPVPRRDDAQRAAIIRRADEAGARDLHATAVHLRGAFLKLGQFASARPDLLPEAYVRELSKLQDRVPPAPASVLRRTIERELGPVDEVFGSFDDHAASAASLAQVHRATLPDGRPVAVKVMYPRVRALVPGEARDVQRILRLVAHLVRGIDLPTIGDALAGSLIAEVDYAAEAANLEAFAAAFADEPQIVIPGLHRERCSDEVLTMDWVEGENLARALAVADPDVASEALRLLVDAFLKQILVDGLLHADPHPGNFLLQTDGPELRLGMVDFGAVDRIPDRTRLALRDLYRCGIEQDFDGVGDALHELGFRTRSGDVAGLVAFASLFSFDDDQSSREENFNRLVQAAKENPLVKIPDELIMVGRVLIVQTGLVGNLRPTWSMQELVASRLDP